jgi:predicted esterase
VVDQGQPRRRAVVRGAWLCAGLAVLGCAAEDSSTSGEGREGQETVTPKSDDEHTLGRLVHRSGPPRATGQARTGRFRLDVGGGRPAVVNVPTGTGKSPLRLVVLLHGAGGEPGRTVELLAPYAEEHRLLLVAPASRSTTWDVIGGGFGPDVAMIDDLLRRITADHAVSGSSVAGFSDGASYALTLGIVNGDVFDSVMAFSPGFAAARVRHGSPRFFISHGIGDKVLPIDRCSRRLVPELEESGYDVTYEEFDGGHEVPGVIREQAMAWLTGLTG